jgi:hypothetical protein
MRLYLLVKALCTLRSTALAELFQSPALRQCFAYLFGERFHEFGLHQLPLLSF